MTIFVSLKKPGTRRNAVERQTFVLPDAFLDEGGGKSLGDFLDALTEACYARYQEKASGGVLRFLSPEDIEEQGSGGRIRFGLLSGKKAPPLAEAQNNTRQSYLDGLIALFIDGVQLSGPQFSAPLETPVCLKEGSSVVLVRLTMLAGRMW